MAVTVIVNFVAQPGKRDELIEFLKGVQGPAIEAGCHSIAVHSVDGDDDKVVEVEYWDSAAAHSGWVDAAAKAGAFEPLDSILAGPFEILYCTAAKKSEA